jgi:hypothetical protein
VNKQYFVLKRYHDFFRPSVNDPFSIPAEVPNSLQRRFTSFSALARAFFLDLPSASEPLPFQLSVRHKISPHNSNG